MFSRQETKKKKKIDHRERDVRLSYLMEVYSMFWVITITNKRVFIYTEGKMGVNLR